MRLIAIVASLLPLTAPTAFADLSWEYVDERTKQTKEVLEHKPAVEAAVESETARQEQAPRELPVAPPVPAEQPPAAPEPSSGPSRDDAYSALAEALEGHPDMAALNQAETKAAKDYNQAVASGNPVAVSITSQALARAKANRYKKAMSIPELRAAIETWQKATIEAKPENASATEAALETIQSKLKALSKAIAAEYAE